MIGISYAITVKDELQEIKTLLVELFSSIRDQDEIVLLWDEKNGDPKVWEYLNLVALTDDNLFKGVNIHKAPFEGHFADWKNRLTNLCSKEFIFNIDADEAPNRTLLQNLPHILESNEVDMIRVPRVNTVEGLTQKHIQDWRWNVNEQGWVNWPDWQMRIYKNHPDIKWKNRVHEVLEGFKVHGILPMEEEFALYHPKTIERQEKQNEYYNTL